MDSFEFNGGNSDIMHGNSNLDSVCKEATSEKCFEEENEFINEELNGDFKLMLSPKKNYLSPGKKKLRKLKTESTNVENVHKAFTLMSSKSSKRKTSNEVEISSDDTEEFNGFDLKDLEMFEPGNVILKKLIAEVETSNYLMPKRRKTLPSWKNVKNADYLIDEMDDNTTDSEDQKAVAESDVYNITADESSSKSEKSANSSLSISSNRSKKGRLSRGASPGNAIRQKVSVDIKNPAYREPFKYGWKRELVYRAGASENQVRRMADIYYYTPEGKKVRSFREVIVSLTTSDLTIDNFTFFKEPLGINDPLKEIIRDAKKAKDSFSNKSAKKLSKKAVELLSTKKISIKKGVEKSLPGTVAFKASPKTVKVPATFKVKLPPKRDILKKDAKSPPMIPVENEVSSPPIWGTPNIRKQPLTEKSSLIKSKKLIKAKVQEPCSIRCSTSMGLVPSLQCYVCLCLYHSECAGKHEVKRSPTFVCKNCQLEIDDSLQYESVPALNPPPLIPISILSAQNSMPIDQTGTLPKLQLIPKLDTEGSTQSDVLNISKIGSSDNQIILNEKIKKKWYPENENKFLPDRELVLLKPAQNIVSMNNKKFIVIPKNNAMAVQPAMTLRKDKIEDSKLHFLNNVDVSSCQTDIEMLNPILNTANVSNMHLLNSGKNIKSTVDKLESSIFENPVALSDKSLSPISTNLFKENFFDTHILLHTNPENQYNAFSPSMRKKKVLAEHYKAMQLDTFFKNTRKKQTLPDTDHHQYFMVSVCAGYHALSRIFQYLKVQELLRAARVCRMWRDLAAHPSLWKTVRMKNSQVTDWNGLADTLKSRGTQHLDLRKMLIVGEADNVWKKFIAVIPRITTLIKLEMCRCPADVVEEVMKNCSQLKVLNAMSIKCDSLNLESASSLNNCNELRLKAINGMAIEGDLTPLLQISNITHLSLTSVKDLGKKKIEILKSLSSLKTLELGECSDFPEKFGTAVLSNLHNLERLRLEKGQGSCCTFDILEGIAKLGNLTQLELVNFDVKNGFDKYLANCKNIKRLLIIPTYVSQSATSNNMILGGVTELSDSLTHFVWGVTQELLRVTELFVDQCNQMSKQITGDSIPVLKPVPCLHLIDDIADSKTQNHKDDKQPNLSNPQVEILPLPHLQKLLLTALPKTRVKILKIPFHATWRQSISDSASQ